MRILISDSRRLVRLAVKDCLSGEPDFHIVGDASDGLQTLNLVRDLTPDALVLGLTLAHFDGIQVASILRTEAPNCKIIILSMRHDRFALVEAMKAGVAAYLSKSCYSEDLVQTLRKITDKSAVLPVVLGNTLPQIYELCFANGQFYDGELSEREREILRLLANGNSVRDVAAVLHISEKTVDVHRTHIKRKLGVSHITDLTRTALRLGLVEN